MKLYSLKTKMGLVVSGLITILIVSIGLYGIFYFTNIYKEMMIEQETLLVNSMAKQMEDKLDSVQATLVVTSKEVSPDILIDPQKAQAFLDSKAGLITIFDNHIFLFSMSGQIIAESPYEPGRRGLDLSQREYMQTTLKQKAAYIGKPYFSSQDHQHPAIMLTAPIYDENGEMIAIMGGGLDLMKDNFLGGLPYTKVGKNGYFYISDTERVTIVHPDSKRVLKEYTPEGVDKVYDQAIQGMDCAGETVNSMGVPQLGTFKHLNNVNWILAANHPLEEVYAPFIQAQNLAVLAIPFGFLVIIIVVWYVVRTMTMPLVLLTQHVKNLHYKQGKERYSTILPKDEIGALSIAFNKMLDELDKKTEALREANDGLEVKVENRTQELTAMNEELIAMNEALEMEIVERQRVEQELTQAISNLKSMQVQLIQSEKMAALGGLVAGVAHEINTPVGVGITASTHLQQVTKDFLDLYQNGGLRRKDLADYLGNVEESSTIIIKNLERAGKLIHSFKQVSVDQSNEMQREFHVKKYLEEILLSINPRIKKTKQHIVVQCDDELMIKSFPGAFAQIVTNLVMNSLIHAYQPEDQGTIRMIVQKQEQCIAFTYSDDGKGIEQKILARIFEPFFTTKRGTGGTGLGLHVVYNIVTQQFGGKIQCDSIPGEGTTFEILLPIKE